MATVRIVYSNNPADIPLRVLLNDLDALDAAVPELEAHLKGRYPKIRQVRVYRRNPFLSPDWNQWNQLQNTPYFHDVSLALAFTGKAVATAVITKISQDAFKFLKKRLPKLTKGRKRESVRSRSTSKRSLRRKPKNNRAK